MKGKMVCVSIGVVLLMLLMPLNSVARQESFMSIEKASPLFSQRLNQHTQRHNNLVEVFFIGKGSDLPFTISDSSDLHTWISRGLQVFGKNRGMMFPLVQKICRDSDIGGLISEYRDGAETREFFNQLMYNPVCVESHVAQALAIIDEQDIWFADPPEPVGFSGQPGCLIGFFIVLPIIVMIGTMIATFTIITCLNINSCFETIMQNILEGFSQGLDLP